VIGVSRRPGPVGEHLAADLADRASWASVGDRMRETLADPAIVGAVLLHFAGIATPHTSAGDAPPEEYAASVLLDAASGPILGTAFLRAARAVSCAVASSPRSAATATTPARSSRSAPPGVRPG
jgi:hypothetical protein